MAHQGDYEQKRFNKRRNKYNEYVNFIDNQNYAVKDLLEHFPSYVGHMTLSRSLTFYELYKKVEGISGHIADVGVHKGFSAILMAKLVRMNESEAFTQVHGFDWFKGTAKDTESRVGAGTYVQDEDELIKLIKMQDLDDILLLHNLDLTCELESFFNKLEHLMFKLVILDAGFYGVLKESIPRFWDRLTPGGIMIIDQYNHELSPGETRAVREFLPNIKIQTIKNSWMPTAFVEKPYKI